MTVGFNSTLYETTERKKQVTVCVEVLNTDNGQAVQPFTVALLPVQGMVNSESVYKLSLWLNVSTTHLVKTIDNVRSSRGWRAIKPLIE